MPKVTLFTADNCQPCRMAKKFLDAQGVEYEEKKAKDHIDLIAELGYRQAPVIMTDTGEHFYGFNIGKLQQIAAGG